MTDAPPSVPELLRREAQSFRNATPGGLQMESDKRNLRAAAIIEAAAELCEHLRNHWYRGEACDEFERRVREVLG